MPCRRRTGARSLTWIEYAHHSQTQPTVARQLFGLNYVVDWEVLIGSMETREFIRYLVNVNVNVNMALVFD